MSFFPDFDSCTITVSLASNTYFDRAGNGNKPYVFSFQYTLVVRNVFHYERYCCQPSGIVIDSGLLCSTTLAGR